jgi:hypothetical protein
MQFGLIAKNSLAAIALAGFTLAPFSALAQSHGHGHGHGPSRNSHSRKESKWNGSDVARGHQNRDSHYGKNDTRTRYGRSDSQFRQYDSRYRQSEYDRRNQTKNEWKNLAIGSGLIGVLGLLTKEPSLTFAGAAGALYSAYRYEQDRKSQSKLARARAYYFSQPYFYRDGHRYDRRTVTKNGQRYFQFIRR